jgi:hypothetical protein
MSDQVVQGQVIDSVTKKPIAGIRVSVNSTASQGTIQSTNTDPNGDFIIYLDEPLDPGQAYVDFQDGAGKYNEQTWGDATVDFSGPIPLDPINITTPVPSWVWIVSILGLLVVGFYLYKRLKK